MYSDDELLPLSGLQHFAYCKRQYALIHIEQVWSESADTLRGEFFHERVDAAGYECSSGVRAERRVRLKSSELGLYGVADIVEFELEEERIRVTPVEYKVGRPKKKDWDRLQVAAQAICLEEMYGSTIEVGFIFYGETRHREGIRINEELRQKVCEVAYHMHEAYELQSIPQVDYNSRCKRCSLLDICMPAAVARDASHYWEEMDEGW
ncbi:MAG: CRISPR-associated protein Cas4 [Coriobacteriales bacterium]|nr:CRISPR-associated protein Cas4 [Coriobacteriales bacterium]